MGRLITGGPPKFITKRYLLGFIQWLDLQDLKVLNMAAVKIQSAFRTFVIKKKYFYARKQAKDFVKLDKQELLRDL